MSTEAIVAQHVHQLFQRLPMLSGFWLRPDLELAELSIFTWPGYTAGRDLYEEVMQSLVELADERPDAVLADESARVLSWDALVPAGQIRVTVAEGCLTLEGEVDRAQQSEAAEQAVLPLIGVKHVENRITIRPMWTSQELQPEIMLALRRHRELHTRRVRVDARGGIVVLRGRVPSIAERSAIEHAMWSVAGVTGVVDELTIAR